jgi:hypothetical protein
MGKEMNKQIRLLAEKAGFNLHNDPIDGHSFNHEIERLVELIINECIDQVAGTKIVGQLSGDKFAELSESADNKYKQWNNALVIATMNVRDHFGVEE